MNFKDHDKKAMNKNIEQLERVNSVQLSSEVELAAFNQAYAHLTRLIRRNTSQRQVREAIKSIVTDWPNRQQMLAERLKSDFFESGRFKTGKACWELGATYGAQKMFSAGDGDPGKSQWS